MTDVERKIRLTRFLREENAVNRMQMRSREEILYGIFSIIIQSEKHIKS